MNEKKSKFEVPGAFVALALALVMGSADALAGTSTHGGDTPLDRDNVWYLGDVPVEYCIEIAPSFSVPAPQVQGAVGEAINRWGAFFHKYGLDQARFPYLNGGAALGLSLHFVQVPRCTQPATQLRILFGVSDPTVERARQTAEFPFGFSIRGDYNHQTYRNGGIIWIRDWNYAPPALLQILLHEFGHVFGMEHDTLPVMDSAIGKQILQSSYEAASAFGMVETPTWLYNIRPGDTIDFTFNGRLIAPDGTRCEPNFLVWPFRDLFGLEQSACHTLRLHFDGIERQPITAVDLTLQLAQQPLPGQPGPKLVTLSGPFSFRPTPNQGRQVSQGPALHTNRFCPECGPQGSMMSDHLDHTQLVFPLEGTLRTGTQVFPAVLDRMKGYYLRVFFPNHNIWWGVENYMSTPYLREQPQTGAFYPIRRFPSRWLEILADCRPLKPL